MRLALVLISVLGLFPVAAAGAGGFDNPGFDTDAASWTTFNIDGAGGWQSTGGNPGGNFIVNDNGPCASDPTASQLVTGLTIGKDYLVSIDYSPRHTGFGDPLALSFGILLDGSAIGEFTRGPPGWTTVSASFTATSTSHNIGFAGERNCDDSDYAIDNAALIVMTNPPPTPELGSMLLVGAGVLAIGAVVMLRRD